MIYLYKQLISSTVYIVWRKYSIIKMEYTRNGLNIYKTY